MTDLKSEYKMFEEPNEMLKELAIVSNINVHISFDPLCQHNQRYVNTPLNQLTFFVLDKLLSYCYNKQVTG